jgi:mono/diheme cytochrome c family protein
MKRGILSLAIAAVAWTLHAQSQDPAEILRRGEDVYTANCATGYCHGPRGATAGAPRLAARGFDLPFLNGTIGRGVSGTAMAGFSGKLPPGDLAAVVAYVANLNGIVNVAPSAGGLGGATASPSPRSLSPDATRGRDLFIDAVRGVDRCSTCHEVDGLGIPVAAPIATIPADVQALRAMATPRVATATLDGQAMPALVISKGSRVAIFYDLTARPPVLRTTEPGAAAFIDGSAWQHSSALGSYNTAALDSILAFLRAAVTP